MVGPVHNHREIALLKNCGSKDLVPMLDAFLGLGNDVLFHARQNGIDELGVTAILIYHQGRVLFGHVRPLSRKLQETKASRHQDAGCQ